MDYILNEEMTTMNTKQLDECLVGVSNGDLSYMHDLYNMTKNNIYAYALSILRNKEDAQDVCHDCYVAIYNAAYQYTSKGKPLAWMMTITRNLALAKLKERQRYDDRPIEDFQLSKKERLSSVDKITIETCMNILDNQERQIVILHAVSGFKHREIAQIMNIPLPTVLSKYHRAMKKYKNEIMKGMDYEQQTSK